MEIINTVYKTDNYDLFKFSKLNRDIHNGHLKRITKSISEKNLTIDNPIKVDNDFNIIDGQHTFTACKSLGLPVYFMYVKGSNLFDISSFNKVNRVWKPDDYLKHFKGEEKPEYIIFHNFMKDNDIDTAYKALSILTINIMREGGRRIFEKFKNGRLSDIKIDYNKGAKRISHLKDLSIYTDGLSFHRSLITSLSCIEKTPQFNWDIFNKRKKFIKPWGFKSAIELVRKIEDDYNYNLSPKNHIIILMP